MLRADLEAELLQQVKASSPAFFERLVVELLVKMSYGDSRQDAGRAISRTGDGGIDGIINEDRLGLDVVDIQAKRTVAAVKTLRRDLREPQRYFEEPPPETEPQLKISDIIPCSVVAYMGHMTIEGLQQRLASTAETCRPDGTLVIELECFVGLNGTASGAEGLFAFVAELVVHVNRTTGAVYPNRRAYLHGIG